MIFNQCFILQIRKSFYFLWSDQRFFSCPFLSFIQASTSHFLVYLWDFAVHRSLFLTWAWTTLSQKSTLLNSTTVLVNSFLWQLWKPKLTKRGPKQECITTPMSKLFLFTYNWASMSSFCSQEANLPKRYIW